ncbi:transcription factor TT8-like [Andrographis paniculata]|uniref:transcription factor TT8-like n=1 Tax=Andrographis paniculata TaxID=175694 RepID=UPI0021E84898|nr:transcription factor TT8-like [Andrographis paniculata]XP_051127790.1 transcription factor TT8-like [Andrographis paniculata]
MGNGGKEQLMKKENEEDEITRLLLGIMEGYNDHVIPPLSYFSPFPNANVEKGSGSRKRQMDEASWAENLFKERKRREKMSQKFSVLQSMVPTLFNTFKPSKEKIIGDTVDYIKHLEAEIQRLEDLNNVRREDPKPLLLQCADDNSSADITVSNGATFVAIQLPFRSGLVPKILMVFEKHKAEILEARVQAEDHRLLTFTATILLGSDQGSAVDKIREEILTL